MSIAVIALAEASTVLLAFLLDMVPSNMRILPSSEPTTMSPLPAAQRVGFHHDQGYQIIVQL